MDPQNSSAHHVVVGLFAVLIVVDCLIATPAPPVILRDLEFGGEEMGQVLYQYDIKTPGPNKDVNAMVDVIRNNLPEHVTMQEKVEIKKLYFGIEAAVCQFTTPEDVEGIQDTLENYLNELEETGELELTFTTRL
jgi:translation elongation factor EF-1beta